MRGRCRAFPRAFSTHRHSLPRYPRPRQRGVSVTAGGSDLPRHRPTPTLHIRVRSWCSAFCGFGQRHRIIQSIPAALKTLRVPPINTSLLPTALLAAGDLVTVSVFSFSRVSHGWNHTACTRLPGLSRMHLCLLHGFSWLDSSSLFEGNFNFEEILSLFFPIVCGVFLFHSFFFVICFFLLKINLLVFL